MVLVHQPRLLSLLGQRNKLNRLIQGQHLDFKRDLELSGMMRERMLGMLPLLELSKVVGILLPLWLVKLLLLIQFVLQQVLLIGQFLLQLVSDC